VGFSFNAYTPSNGISTLWTFVNNLECRVQVSSLEKNSNIVVMILVACVFVVCVALAGAANAWVSTNNGHFYIPMGTTWPEPQQGIYLVCVQFLRYYLDCVSILKGSLIRY
jgi:hypothetical protein